MFLQSRHKISPDVQHCFSFTSWPACTGLFPAVISTSASTPITLQRPNRTFLYWDTVVTCQWYVTGIPQNQKDSLVNLSWHPCLGAVESKYIFSGQRLSLSPQKSFWLQKLLQNSSSFGKVDRAALHKVWVLPSYFMQTRIRKAYPK